MITEQTPIPHVDVKNHIHGISQLDRLIPVILQSVSTGSVKKPSDIEIKDAQLITRQYTNLKTYLHTQLGFSLKNEKPLNKQYSDASLEHQIIIAARLINQTICSIYTYYKVQLPNLFVIPILAFPVRFRESIYQLANIDFTKILHELNPQPSIIASNSLIFSQRIIIGTLPVYVLLSTIYTKKTDQMLITQRLAECDCDLKIKLNFPGSLPHTLLEPREYLRSLIPAFRKTFGLTDSDYFSFPDHGPAYCSRKVAEPKIDKVMTYEQHPAVTSMHLNYNLTTEQFCIPVSFSIDNLINRTINIDLTENHYINYLKGQIIADQQHSHEYSYEYSEYLASKSYLQYLIKSLINLNGLGFYVNQSRETIHRLILANDQLLLDTIKKYPELITKLSERFVLSKDSQYIINLKQRYIDLNPESLPVPISILAPKPEQELIHEPVPVPTLAPEPKQESTPEPKPELELELEPSQVTLEAQVSQRQMVVDKYLKTQDKQRSKAEEKRKEKARKTKQETKSESESGKIQKDINKPSVKPQQPKQKPLEQQRAKKSEFEKEEQQALEKAIADEKKTREHNSQAKAKKEAQEIETRLSKIKTKISSFNNGNYNEENIAIKKYLYTLERLAIATFDDDKSTNGALAPESHIIINNYMDYLINEIDDLLFLCQYQDYFYVNNHDNTSLFLTLIKQSIKNFADELSKRIKKSNEHDRFIKPIINKLSKVTNKTGTLLKKLLDSNNIECKLLGLSEVLIIYINSNNLHYLLYIKSAKTKAIFQGEIEVVIALSNAISSQYFKNYYENSDKIVTIDDASDKKTFATLEFLKVCTIITNTLLIYRTQTLKMLEQITDQSPDIKLLKAANEQLKRFLGVIIPFIDNSNTIKSDIININIFNLYTAILLNIIEIKRLGEDLKTFEIIDKKVVFKLLSYVAKQPDLINNLNEPLIIKSCNILTSYIGAFVTIDDNGNATGINLDYDSIQSIYNKAFSLIVLASRVSRGQPSDNINHAIGNLSAALTYLGKGNPSLLCMASLPIKEVLEHEDCDDKVKESFVFLINILINTVLSRELAIKDIADPRNLPFALYGKTNSLCENFNLIWVYRARLGEVGASVTLDFAGHLLRNYVESISKLYQLSIDFTAKVAPGYFSIPAMHELNIAIKQVGNEPYFDDLFNKLKELLFSDESIANGEDLVLTTKEVYEIMIAYYKTMYARLIKYHIQTHATQQSTTATVLHAYKHPIVDTKMTQGVTTKPPV